MADYDYRDYPRETIPKYTSADDIVLPGPTAPYYDNTRTQILREAEKVLNGPRQEEYGPPSVNFQRIADRWKVTFPERNWTAADVALALIDVKMGRATQGYTYDTAVDIAGYAGLWGELEEEEG